MIKWRHLSKLLLAKKKGGGMDGKHDGCMFMCENIA